jgi:hypothetical protein
VQRSCGNPGCDVVDGRNRNTVDLGDGRCVYFHLPDDEACGALGADPRPDLDESAHDSQVREGLRALGVEKPDSEPMNIPSVDCSDPANHYQPADQEA